MECIETTEIMLMETSRLLALKCIGPARF
jgi:hypothetical protein